MPFFLLLICNKFEQVLFRCYICFMMLQLILFASGTVVILSITILLLRWIHFSNKQEAKKEWTKIPPRLLIQTIVDWASQHIQLGKKRRIRPVIHIRNNLREDVMGSYCFYTKTILIDYRKHNCLSTLTDTVLHEFVHHLQIRHQKDKSKYTVLLRKKGYTENPFEIEARQLSAKHLKTCLKAIPFK